MGAVPPAVFGQESSSQSNSSSSSSPAPSSAPATPSSPFGPAPAPATPPGGTTTGGTTTGGTTAAPLTGNLSGPSGLGGTSLQNTPTTFSVSTGYGQAPAIFTSGEGRLARPKFETHVTGSIGFDDNIFSTPTNGPDIPEQRFQVQVTEEIPDQIVVEVVPPKRGQAAPIGVPIGPAPTPVQTRTRIIKGTPAQFEEIVIPGQEAAKRQASLITRSSVMFQAQMASRRQLFTFDLNVNADYYWNRPTKKSDYNGNLSLIYLRRITPRLQFTASVNAVYTQQPDLARINTPTTPSGGSYIDFNSKFDLSYRWSPRFSTVTSYSYHQLFFEESGEQSGNYTDMTLGTELKYLFSPRFTGVLEGRVSQIKYENNPELDARTYYGLVGMELVLARRASASARLGASMRTFEQSGKNAVAPYLETALNYQLGRASYAQWTSRLGFEEPNSPDEEVLVLRSGISINHVFTPRLRGSLSLTAIHRLSDNSATDEQTVEDTIDSALNLNYTFSRHWNFNLSYTYTNFLDQSGDEDYFRNRVNFGFDYEF